MFLFIHDFLSRINTIKIFIFLTFLFAILNLKFKNKQHIFLLMVLIDCVATEIISSVLKSIKINSIQLYSISFIFHQALWISLISWSINKKELGKILVASFTTFGLINICFIEKSNLNYLTFISGALIYIVLFLFQSYRKLNEEELSYFTGNEYILLFAPVIFFFGLSFIFGFRNLQLLYIIIFGKTTLYTFIVYFANIVYYSLINLYIYRERKLINRHHEH